MDSDPAPQNSGSLSHFDAAGRAVMVDVSEKPVTVRTAAAEGEIAVSAAVFKAAVSCGAAKGDVLGTARLAGIMAVKRTADLIPLCHPLPVAHCGVEFYPDRETLTIRAVCRVRVTGRTGAEMEALTGAAAALLTIYDMTKALGKDMEIRRLRLLEKTGGKSGDYRAGGSREEQP